MQFKGPKAEQVSLWEILVPTVRPDGRPIHTRFHRVWDKEIEKISGGMIYHPGHGRWVSDGKRYAERMIPVRIMCTRAEILRIADWTVKYYDQKAVMAYKAGDDIIMRYASEI